LGNLAEDELMYFLIFNEDLIIQQEVTTALEILRKRDIEKIKRIEVINEKDHYIELDCIIERQNMDPIKIESYTEIKKELERSIFIYGIGRSSISTE
jgi:hypothetical protein